MTRRHILFSLIMLAIVLSACSMEPSTGDTLRLYQDDVDPRFREFYDWLGGEETLGVPISPKFSQDGYEYQYTATALMVYFPNSADNHRFQFAPLGNELGLTELPLSPGALSVDDIYPDFLDLYTEMGGTRYVGLPISEPRYNADKGRIEQYFENLGFYHLETDIEDVRLLQYGAWKCADECGYTPIEDAEVVQWSLAGSSFDAAVQRLNPSFTGYPLTEPYTAFDGVMEQIFENVVVVADPNNPGNIGLRPIPGLIGIPTGNNDHYSVPEVLLEFIYRNSGLEFSGQPVSEYKELSPEVYRQCFTNLCLDYYPSEQTGLYIHLVPLGYTYKRMFFMSDVSPSGGADSQKVTIIVWETFPLLTNNQQQEIGVRVESDGVAIKNVEPILTVIIPNASEIKYTLPPTNHKGTTYLELVPIHAANGSRIQYKVCVRSFGGELTCVVDDFLIWTE